MLVVGCVARVHLSAAVARNQGGEGFVEKNRVSLAKSASRVEQVGIDGGAHAFAGQATSMPLGQAQLGPPCAAAASGRLQSGLGCFPGQEGHGHRVVARLRRMPADIEHRRRSRPAAGAAEAALALRVEPEGSACDVYLHNLKTNHLG